MVAEVSGLAAGVSGLAAGVSGLVAGVSGLVAGMWHVGSHTALYSQLRLLFECSISHSVPLSTSCHPVLLVCHPRADSRSSGTSSTTFLADE